MDSFLFWLLYNALDKLIDNYNSKSQIKCHIICGVISDKYTRGE
jgi:hypothetical protein